MPAPTNQSRRPNSLWRTMTFWAYRRAHPKDKAKLAALDHDKVLKKARRWFADVIGAALRGHVVILLRKMGPK